MTSGANDRDDLELIPRGVRDKLDRVAIKLHLVEWEKLSLEDRARLRDRPCNADAEVEAYRVLVTNLVRRHCGKEPDCLT